MPDVINATFEEAKAELEAAGFVVDPESVPNTDVPEGQVFDQDPPPGTRAEKGSTVTLKVSAGEQKEPVPALVNLGRSAAESLLENQGFIPDPKEEFPDEVPAGDVISQDPAAGTEVPRGSVVTIVISKGPAPVAIADVRGRTSEEAQQILLGQGLKVRVREQASATVPAGQVIGTEPPQGEEVERGSPVTVIVSSGPPPSSTTTSSSSSSSTSSSTTSSSTTSSSTTTTTT